MCSDVRACTVMLHLSMRSHAAELTLVPGLCLFSLLFRSVPLINP